MKLVFAILAATIAGTAYAWGDSNPCYWSGTVANCLPSAGVYLPNQRDVRFGEATANGSNYVAIQGPSSTSDLTLTLPSAVAQDEVLVSDDGSGTLDFQKIVNANVDASAAIEGSKLQAASASNAGAVDTTTQTFAGDKTFSGIVTLARVVSFSGSQSITTTPATIHTFTEGGVYILSSYVQTGTGVGRQGIYFLTVRSTGPTVDTPVAIVDSGITATVSGADVLIDNSSGTSTAIWAILKLR